jgi:hypothetical protein
MTHGAWNPGLDHPQAYPPYTGAGVLVTYIAEDASEIRVEMSLTDKERRLRRDSEVNQNGP